MGLFGKKDDIEFRVNKLDSELRTLIEQFKSALESKYERKREFFELSERVRILEEKLK